LFFLCIIFCLFLFSFSFSFFKIKKKKKIGLVCGIFAC
jgi:hypothetical protein